MIRALGVLAVTLGVTSASHAQHSYRVLAPHQDVSTQKGVTPAETAHAETPRISLSMQDSSLGVVLAEIAKQAHMHLVHYNSDSVLAKRVSIHLTSARVEEALSRISKLGGIIAKISPDGETIMVRPKSEGSSEQKKSGAVNGRVVDSANGRGLNGATVKIFGTKLGAITTESGRFTILDVPAREQVIEVKLFGYRAMQQTVMVPDSGWVSTRVMLASVPTILSGVVTTATGSQRRIEVGNDITTINVDSVMRAAPISTVTDLLEGRVPGLTVARSSGVPGDPSRIRIRGAGSITRSNDPIFIVDGIRIYSSQSDPRNASLAPQNMTNVRTSLATGSPYAAPSPIDQIDPNSIETIEVFKGPSASAMYGSDAANGVIVITTKKGRSGETHWNVGLTQGTSFIPGDWPLNYYRFGTSPVSPSSDLCAWNDLRCHQDSIVGFQALNDSRYTVLGHGANSEATTTVSGGSTMLQYSIGASAAQTLGYVKLPDVEVARFRKFNGIEPPKWMRRPNNYKDWGANGSVSAQPSRSLNLSLTTSLFNSTQQRSSLEEDIARLQGTYIDASQLDNTSIVQHYYEHVLAKSVTTNYGLTANWRPFSWLPLAATGGLSTVQREDESIVPFGIFVISQGSLQSDTNGSYARGTGNSQTRTFNVGTSDVPLVGHLVSGSAGLNVSTVSTTDFQVATNALSRGVTRPSEFIFDFPRIFTSVNQNTSAQSTYGWYFEPKLNVNSRFFVLPGFRFDGGSASGSDAGLTGFPKMSFSYLAIDPSHPRGLINLLRPRLAFGYAGTQPGPADRLRLFSEIPPDGGYSTTTLDGTTTVRIVRLTDLGNSQLHPERSSEVEGGFDLELWNGRFTTTVTQYHKEKRDAIIAIPSAPSVYGWRVGFGNGSVRRNVGLLRNTGTELTLNAQVLQSRLASWNVDASFSQNSNTVVRLNRGQPIIDFGDGTRVVPGYPLFGRWARPIVSFGDVNHNGIIEPTEIRVGDSLSYMGTSEPKYETSLNSTLSLWDGRVSVSGTVLYVNGVTQFNQNAVENNVYSLIPNAPGTSLATQAAIVAAGANPYLYAGSLGDMGQSLIGFVQTVSTLRFQSLAVNYNVPRSFTQRFHVPRVGVALQGRNLGLHSNYRGKDPNVNAFPYSAQYGSPQRTVDAGQIPEPRTWQLRVTLGN